MSEHVETALGDRHPRPVSDFPCQTCGHLGIVHRRSGGCRPGGETAVGCPCPGYHSDPATHAYIAALESRLTAVWAYLPELGPFVPEGALAPLYELSLLSSRPLTADDVDRARAIAALGVGDEL